VATPAESRVRYIGRYAVHDEIAAGGMATVHFGRLLGQAGFSRTVAIKRLHPQYAKDPEFVAMFMDEARVAARVQHPNVVSTLDVVAREGELFLVMEYIPGESLSKLVRAAARKGEPIETRIAVSIVAGFLHGLHAAHEAKNERGEPLGLVHRDVSPQNVLVGIDGVPRVVDFGVAKAAGRVQTTREGQLKGKLAYMAPEQIHGIEVTRRSDIYAASIVLWELLAGQRLFERESDAAVMLAALTSEPVAPSTIKPGLPERLDRITLRGLSRSPEARYATAREMAIELEEAVVVALPSEVGEWAQSIAGPMLSKRATRVAEIESSSGNEVQLRSDRPPDSGELRTLMTVAAPDVPAKPARKRLGLRVAIALCLASLLGLAFFLRPQTGAPPAAASATPPATAIPPPSAAPAIDEAPAIAPVPPATASAEPAPKSSASAPVPAPPAPPPPAAARAAKHSQSKCDPPYRIDASGHKLFKVECL
jgi:serine/threonine-protein kinase